MNRHQIIRTASVAFILGLAILLYSVDSASVKLLVKDDSSQQLSWSSRITCEDGQRFADNFESELANRYETMADQKIRKSITVSLDENELVIVHPEEGKTERTVVDNIVVVPNNRFEEIRFIEFTKLEKIKVSALPLCFLGS